MIEIYDCSVFDVFSNVIAHQVNCQGVMGSGVAKQIRDRYPEVYTQYKAVCEATTDKSKLLGKALIVELPVNTELGHWTSIIHVDGWCMSASTEHPEESWEFIKFLTSDIDAQRVMGEFATPSLSSYASSEEYLTDSFNKNVYVDMLEYAVGWETTGVWARVNDVIKEQYQLVLAGQSDVDTAIANIQSEGTALLAE